MMGRIPPSMEDARKLSGYFNAVFGDRRLLVCPIKNNGAIEFGDFERLMNDNGYKLPSYEKREISPEKRDDIGGEVRRVLTPVEAIVVPKVDYLVLFDDSIKTGQTMLGSIKWALENRSKIGFEKLYTIARYDIIGLAHFSVEPHYSAWRGPIEIMRNGIPERGIEPFLETLMEIEPELNHIASVPIVGTDDLKQSGAIKSSLDNIREIYRKQQGGV